MAVKKASGKDATQTARKTACTNNVAVKTTRGRIRGRGNSTKEIRVVIVSDSPHTNEVSGVAKPVAGRTGQYVASQLVPRAKVRMRVIQPAGKEGQLKLADIERVVKEIASKRRGK